MSDDAIPQRRSTDLPPDAPWWARWMVANVNEAWKWGSMWWPFLCASALEVYAAMPDEINKAVKAMVPETWVPHLLAVGFAISMLLRVLNLAQIKRQHPEKDTP